MSIVQKAEVRLLRKGVNPKTGRPWTLADPEIKKELEAELEEMKRDPQKARQFLREVGIHTPTGRLTRRYGG